MLFMLWLVGPQIDYFLQKGLQQSNVLYSKIKMLYNGSAMGTSTEQKFYSFNYSSFEVKTN